MACAPAGTALGQFEGVLGAMVGAWEELKAAQEAAAAQEAELFRTKARATTILTEEVRTQLAHPQNENPKPLQERCKHPVCRPLARQNGWQSAALSAWSFLHVLLDGPLHCFC